MTTLHIDRKGAALDADAGTLTVRLNGELAARLPLGPVERLVVSGQATLSTRLLAELWSRGVGLLVLTGRSGEASARLVGRPHDDVALRLAQYRAADNSSEAAGYARALVSAKVRAQARLLTRARDRRPDLRYEMRVAGEVLQTILARLADPAENLDRGPLSGLEGAAASAYFSAFQTLFPPSLKFAGRRRRPPPDPVNACLSLGYTLLHHEAVRETQVAGLDPLVGFLHVPERGRESLACDLVEPLRPHIDEWVWQRFAERDLRAEHFVILPDGRCLMGKAGRAVFYDRFEVLARGLRRLLRGQTRQLAAALRRKPGP
ncbi:MAG: CRISPR-associated endonuclease Cas1 [Acetobacteraceae bacterium]